MWPKGHWDYPCIQAKSNQSEDEEDMQDEDEEDMQDKDEEDMQDEDDLQGEMKDSQNEDDMQDENNLQSSMAAEAEEEDGHHSDHGMFGDKFNVVWSEEENEGEYGET